MIKKLKALQAAQGNGLDRLAANLKFSDALRNLAPELIALWEAVPRVLGDNVECPDCWRSFIPEDPAHLELLNAYKALNAKAAEVLKD